MQLSIILAIIIKKQQDILHLGSASYFHRFSRVCFSFLNLPARLAGTRQRRVFVESHSANTDCGNTVEVPARPTPWIRNLYLFPPPILPQPPHKNKTIKPSSQGAAGERAILFWCRQWKRCRANTWNGELPDFDRSREQACSFSGPRRWEAFHAPSAKAALSVSSH